jgi:nitroreductase
MSVNEEILQAEPVGIACEAPSASELHAIIQAAARAPSGDNMQPWRFTASADGRGIEVYLDAARDSSPMNSGQRMSLIACGAAIQNALLVAAEHGWRTELDVLDNALASRTALAARIRFLDRRARNSAISADRATRIISERVANRRIYYASPVSPARLANLQQRLVAMDGVNVDWITARPTINDLAGIIARGDAIMFGEPSMRAAFLANVRFDLPPNAEADEGLPLASLEANAALTLALRSMKRMPHALFKLAGARWIFAAHARKLVRSSSGLCVVNVRSESQTMELRVGQAMQQAWLALTEFGFAAQPMMSLMVLDNALRNGTPELKAALQRQGTQALLNELDATLKNAGISGRPMFMLRFGYAAPPSGRTGRLRIENA